MEVVKLLMKSVDICLAFERMVSKLVFFHRKIFLLTGFLRGEPGWLELVELEEE